MLLKGNDIWVYGNSNMKALPESYEIRPPGDRCDSAHNYARIAHHASITLDNRCHCDDGMIPREPLTDLVVKTLW